MKLKDRVSKLETHYWDSIFAHLGSYAEEARNNDLQLQAVTQEMRQAISSPELQIPIYFQPYEEDFKRKLKWRLIVDPSFRAIFDRYHSLLDNYVNKKGGIYAEKRISKNTKGGR